MLKNQEGRSFHQEKSKAIANQSAFEPNTFPQVRSRIPPPFQLRAATSLELKEPGECEEFELVEGKCQLGAEPAMISSKDTFKTFSQQAEIEQNNIQPFQLKKSYKFSTQNDQIAEIGPISIDIQQRKERVQTKPQTEGTKLNETGTDNPWETFCNAFNQEFSSILHVFQPKESSRDQTKNGLTVEQAKEKFSDSHRKKLLEFINTKHIPDRLFNDGDIGNTNSRERILISSHILANGKYKPFKQLLNHEQKVHGRMCGHWVRLVWHYAGVTPAGENTGYMESFDHAGNIVFGTGKKEKHVVGIEKIPFTEYDDIEAGTWIMYYNGNDSPGGSHSVIFSKWLGPVQTFIQFVIFKYHFREAEVFDQPSPGHGGRLRKKLKLGGDKESAKKYSIFPISAIIAVKKDSRPANNLKELLPSEIPREENKIQEGNKKFLLGVIKNNKLPYANVDFILPEVKFLLRKENLKSIKYLKKRLSKKQSDLLILANKATDLEMLIRLTQKLRALKINAQLLAESTKKSTSAVKKEYLKKECDLIKINDKIKETEERLAEKEGEKEKISIELLSVKESRRELFKDLKQKPSKELKQEIFQKLNLANKNIPFLERRLKGIDFWIKILKFKKIVLRRELNKIESVSPYGTAIPGRLEGQSKSRISGKLSDLYSSREIAKILLGSLLPVENPEK